MRGGSPESRKGADGAEFRAPKKETGKDNKDLLDAKVSQKRDPEAGSKKDEEKAKVLLDLWMANNPEATPPADLGSGNGIRREKRHKTDFVKGGGTIGSTESLPGMDAGELGRAVAQADKAKKPTIQHEMPKQKGVMDTVKDWFGFGKAEKPPAEVIPFPEKADQDEKRKAG